MTLEVRDVGYIASYPDAYRMQEAHWQARLQGGDTQQDVLLLVEHAPVYTLGKHADPAYVLCKPAELEACGIALVQTDRGGQVTYHGPGQITGYPIVRLTRRGGRGVAWYVEHLEESLIQTLAHFGLDGKRDPINPGVWVQGDKMAAIGVRVRRGITMHGFALNVAVDLAHYAHMVPCGIAGRGVTSMHRYCPGITPADVKPVLVKSFASVFGYTDATPVEGQEEAACVT